MWLEKIPRGRRLWDPTLAQKAAQGWGRSNYGGVVARRCWDRRSAALNCGLLPTEVSSCGIGIHPGTSFSVRDRFLPYYGRSQKWESCTLAELRHQGHLVLT